MNNFSPSGRAGLDLQNHQRALALVVDLRDAPRMGSLTVIEVGTGRWISIACSPWSSMAKLKSSPSTDPSCAIMANDVVVTNDGRTFRLAS